MEKDKNTHLNSVDCVSPSGIENVRSSTCNRLTMILAFLGAAVLYACTPKLTKHQIEVRQEINSRCDKCLGSIRGQVIERVACFEEQLELAGKGKKPSEEKCMRIKNKEGFEMYDCENLCEDAGDRKLKCDSRIMSFYSFEFKELYKRYLCLIGLVKKEGKFDKSMLKKCKQKTRSIPKELKRECGDVLKK